MSVAEMKLAVINKITDLNDEAVLQQVLKLLENASGGKNYNDSLSGNYETIKAQYGDVLRKLAQ